MDKDTIDAAKSIPTFYAGQSIFLTGATGFLGKVFIEKILRCCPNIGEIFILMRPKKGLSLNERLEKMLNLPIYDKLREEQPSNFRKLIAISGDISKENLGLSAVDRQILIERVTIIIHNAASVKFNDSLKYAILTNTRSTRDICILAENMKNLIALVYVSTAFAHLENPFIEEKVYPPIADWRKLIKVAETLDEHILNVFTAKCLDKIPNTYIFSKKLSESIIQEYSAALPCAIVRPSIVTSSLKDPIPGWIDNFNGPMGLLCFAGTGLLRVVYSSKYIPQNMIPVDTVIDTIILVIWKLGLITLTPESTCFVVNCTFPDENNISLQEFVNRGNKIINKIPLEVYFWTITSFITESAIMHYVLTILWHIIPAIILDSVLKFSGRQPMILKLQRKAYIANRTLQHFMCNKWKFDNTNSQYLLSLIPSNNREMFSIDLSDMDMTKYMRVYLFVTTFKTIIAIVMLWMIYKWICF
ncbi:hypothetical protein ACFW04_011299 [Cataglyphis niger]